MLILLDGLQMRDENAKFTRLQGRIIWHVELNLLYLSIDLSIELFLQNISDFVTKLDS